MLHSEAVSFDSKNSEVCMSWNSDEKENSWAEMMGAGISFLHSVILDMYSDGESKKESLKIRH